MYTLSKTLTSILTRKSSPTGRASFWVKFPTVRKKCLGYARGVGDFGTDWYKI